MRAVLTVSFLAAFNALGSMGVLGQNSLDYNMCLDDDAFGAARIAACSRIIDAPQVPVEERAAAYLNRGEAYGNRGDYGSAIADETRALELKASYAEAYNLRAWNYFKSGKPKDGLADAERAVALQPSSAPALDTRAHIYEAVGKRDEAIADYRKALSLDPDLDETRDALVRLGAQP
jgi:tetratricopeptide (TPR) repeat protein